MALWREVSEMTAQVFPQPGVAFIDLHAGFAGLCGGVRGVADGAGGGGDADAAGQGTVDWTGAGHSGVMPAIGSNDP